MSVEQCYKEFVERLKQYDNETDDRHEKKVLAARRELARKVTLILLILLHKLTDQNQQSSLIKLFEEDKTSQILNYKKQMKRHGEGFHITQKQSTFQMLTLFDTKDEKLELNVKLLEFLCEQIGDSPVSITSTIGRYRQGKTLWANCLLKKLRTGESRFESEETIGGDGMIPFKSGSFGHTKGVMIYPEVFFEEDILGNKKAHLLIDVQGTFDPSCDQSISTQLVVITALISSTLVLNAKGQVDLSDLEKMKLVITFCNQFQTLKRHHGQIFGQRFLFLLRDSPQKGFDNRHLEVLEAQAGRIQAHKQLLHDFCGGYSKIDTYHIPPPPLKVFQADREILAKDCEKEDFLNSLCDAADFVIRRSEPKKVDGTALNGKSLKLYITAMNRYYASQNQEDAHQYFQACLQQLAISNNETPFEPSKYEKLLQPIVQKTIEEFKSNRLFTFGTNDERMSRLDEFQKLLENSCKNVKTFNAQLYDACQKGKWNSTHAMALSVAIGSGGSGSIRCNWSRYSRYSTRLHSNC
ncbi:unnamed protein product, partial [Mesorhabditis belari]|uniref:Guanylate-binding protein N-terminal domain-containing protein n=1 Tax=Mesorhabditis belari TaxID=2138241 RepID=A0AAF3EAN8_9BILA